MFNRIWIITLCFEAITSYQKMAILGTEGELGSYSTMDIWDATRRQEEHGSVHKIGLPFRRTKYASLVPVSMQGPSWGLTYVISVGFTDQAHLFIYRWESEAWSFNETCPTSDGTAVLVMAESSGPSQQPAAGEQSSISTKKDSIRTPISCHCDQDKTTSAANGS